MNGGNQESMVNQNFVPNVVNHDRNEHSISSVSNDSSPGFFSMRGLHGFQTNGRIENNATYPQMPPLPNQNPVTVSVTTAGRNNPNVVRGEKEIEVGNGVAGTSIMVTDTDATSPKMMRTMNLIKVYAEGESMPRDKDMERDMKKNFRSAIIPTLKFVRTGKSLGSFEQPDITDETSVANRLFKHFPAINNASDGVKAKYWMTYRGRLKEIVSIHKAKATLSMKRKIIEGKCKLSSYVTWRCLEDANTCCCYFFSDRK